MVVYIGADHRGFPLKEQLKPYIVSLGFDVVDCGNDHHDPEDDFPDFAFAVADKVAGHTAKSIKSRSDLECLGIVICGSGGGVTMAANKVTGIRCGQALDTKDVIHNRLHDDMNVLAIGSDFTDLSQAKAMVKAYLSTPYQPEPRFVRRLNKIAARDQKTDK
jgi:ribose 5-phosphate isomerase B